VRPKREERHLNFDPGEFLLEDEDGKKR